MNDKTSAITTPKKVRIIFSVMNCQTKTFDDAPNALRTPISDDRSMILLMFMFTRFSVGSNIMNETKMIMTVTIIVIALSLLFMEMKLMR
jgi:hypothetical protein